MKAPGFCPTDTLYTLDENFDYGLFPYPNATGDAKTIVPGRYYIYEKMKIVMRL